MSLDPALARLQARLLASLADGAPDPDVRALALADAPDDDVAAWVRGWDDDQLGLAGLLVRTWARRDPQG